MLNNAVELIKNAKRILAFTGAGISVESGIPPFRGKNGLWNKYDPNILDINHFQNEPLKSWKLIKKLLFDSFHAAKPNEAHLGLAQMAQKGYLQSIITQNIDSLHQQAGNKRVYEMHGNSRNLICLDCHHEEPVTPHHLNNLPPRCQLCNGLLKPDFIFFGEAMYQPDTDNSFQEAEKADLLIVIGTTGEVMPASQIPIIAQQNQANIIEINTEETKYTQSITDIFLPGKATAVVEAIVSKL